MNVINVDNPRRWSGFKARRCMLWLIRWLPTATVSLTMIKIKAAISNGVGNSKLLTPALQERACPEKKKTDYL